jgi:predicted transcriptional regulator
MGLATILSDRMSINILNQLYPHNRSKNERIIPTSPFSLFLLERSFHCPIKRETLLNLSDADLIKIKAPYNADHHLQTITTHELATLWDHYHPSKRFKQQLRMEITEKGMDFVQEFDKLREIFYNTNQTSLDEEQQTEQDNRKPQPIAIEYVLTELEQKILHTIYHASEDHTKSLPTKKLVKELYPQESYNKKSSLISKYTKKLTELNLLTKEKQNNETVLTLTPTGIRTAQTYEQSSH